MAIRRPKRQNRQKSQGTNSQFSSNNKLKKTVNIYSGNGLKSKLKVYPNTLSPINEKGKCPPISKVNREISSKSKLKIREKEGLKKGLKLAKAKGIPLALKSKQRDLPPEKEDSWEFFNPDNLESEDSGKNLQELTNKRVVRREISDGHTLDDLTILERIKLGFKVRRKITNKDLLEQQKEELRRLEHEQTYYQTVKYFVQKETDILYTERDIQTVVIQVDRKFSEYLPKLKEDLSYLVFTEKPPTKDVLLAYGNIPHLFYVSLRKF